MKILIIEDEAIAARRIKKMVTGFNDANEIVGQVDSVEDAVHWFETNPSPDLILCDVELADGQSFEIFNKTTVSSPVIFTTAYDEYAIKAFKVNSVDYFSYRERFLIKQGQRYFTITTDEVAYFYTKDKVVFLKCRNNKEYIIDYSLDDLEKEMDPNIFFRANRQFLVELKSVDKIHMWFNSKLKVQLRPEASEELVISREKAGEFKLWLGE
jgi:two-component system LytT family response regulator